MKPLILGEAPGRPRGSARDWRLITEHFPLSGAVGVRLCRLAGLEPDEQGSHYARHYWPLRRAYDLSNLLPDWPGPEGKGSAFPMDAAKEALSSRAEEWTGRTIILLGRRLMIAWGLGTRPFYQWDDLPPGPCPVVVGIPHPSGLTRNYNDLVERAKAREVLQRAREIA